MRVVVACECSGLVRDAFLARGHDAISADFKQTERPGPHYLGDARDLLDDGVDLLIAHPPCTYLCRAGERWLHDPRPSTSTCLRGPDRLEALSDAVALFRDFLDAPVPRVAIENPRMNRAAREALGIHRPSQVIHPWEHGHGETKATGLWLRGLPPLMPTALHAGRVPRLHRLSPGPKRAEERSRTYPGIAAAMAEQWGDL